MNWSLIKSGSCVGDHDVAIPRLVVVEGLDSRTVYLQVHLAKLDHRVEVDVKDQKVLLPDDRINILTVVHISPSHLIVEDIGHQVGGQIVLLNLKITGLWIVDFIQIIGGVFIEDGVSCAGTPLLGQDVALEPRVIKEISKGICSQSEEKQKYT